MKSRAPEASFRWANRWMRHFQRIGAKSRKDTSPMAKSARNICLRRGWDYENTSIFEETQQVRDLFQ
jgi:hypothetical protein